MKMKRILLIPILLFAAVLNVGCSSDKELREIGCFEGCISRINDESVLLTIIESPENSKDFSPTWIICKRSDLSGRKIQLNDVISFSIIKYKAITRQSTITTGWEVPEYECSVKPCE